MTLKRQIRDEIDEQTLYPADDGVPMDDSKHPANAEILRGSLEAWLSTPAFIAVNNFIYYEYGFPKNNVGPDFYVVLDTPSDPERDCWRAWNEGGRFPHVIIELLSKHSKKKDYVTNFAIYRDRLRVPDYFICDNRRYHLDGWHLEGGEYVPLKPNEQGRLWCEPLRLWVGFHEGWLRWFDEDAKMLLTGEERAARAEERLAQADERLAQAEERSARSERQLRALRAEIERLKGTRRADGSR